MNENTVLLKSFVNWLTIRLITDPKSVKLMTGEIFQEVASPLSSTTFEDLGTNAKKMLDYSNAASFCISQNAGKEMFEEILRKNKVNKTTHEMLEATPAYA